MKLNGNAYPEGSFKIIESDAPDMEIIDAMLTGKGPYNVPVYVVRNYYSQEDCNHIKETFCQIIDDTLGGNRIEDFVKVHQIGSTQFKKTTLEYFEECERSSADINRLIAVVKDDKARNDFMFEQTFKTYYSHKSIDFRPSSYAGKFCNMMTARRWNNNTELSLLAHEDSSQLLVAAIDQYEICNVKQVIALNLCVENSNGAELILWNIAPNMESKVSLGLENTGYPYALELLEGIDYLNLKTYPGDLYFINANYIHAVSKQKENKRISLGRFIGYAAENKVVYWT